MNKRTYSNLRKHPRSAAATAFTLSRILKESGFKKASAQTTEGFFVKRYSNTVHVGYQLENNHTLRRSMEDQMREALFECGYVSTNPHASIYIDCQTR